MLTWTEPKSDGGAIVTDYVIERRSGVHWIPLKQKTTLTTYQVSVSGQPQCLHVHAHVGAESDVKLYMYI